jgi:ribosomal protection tetracycline resistance protein
LGILAHVDAGKTTLTERLLYDAGVIDELGSVDDGTTQTDSLALERQRGITIKAAVVSFVVADVTANLIDTPGHPDFIAEVDRALGVLDGAVLVISAVEGVQPQTRILFRALQRLQIPTLIFLNKVDRLGANPDRVMAETAGKLTSAVVPMGSTGDLGTLHARVTSFGPADGGFVADLVEALSVHDEALLATYVAEPAVSYRRLRDALAIQTGQALVYPVFSGSALTGAGVDALSSGIAELLPAAEGDTDVPVSATVFKIDRGSAGEKIAYVRIFAGTLYTRDQLRLPRGEQQRVTAISVFEHGSDVRRASVSAGQIAKVWGLGAARIGDALGAPEGSDANQFAPPTLEAVVVARNQKDRAWLYAALTQLAEQDPLISLHRDHPRQEVSVTLYGDVQKEVIAETLAAEFGVEVAFRETTTICIERPIGVGAAAQLLQDDDNPTSATVGLRLEPAANGSGVEFRLEVDPRTVPTHIYKTVEAFTRHMDDYVRHGLREGLYGWEVTDCVVTMNQCNYYVGDGPSKPNRPTPRSTAAHFRRLTPIVTMAAVARARTAVCAPVMRLTIECPSESLGGVLALVTRLGGASDKIAPGSGLSVVRTLLPAAQVQDLRRQLASVTGGEAVAEVSFAGYEQLPGLPPTRDSRLSQ